MHDEGESLGVLIDNLESLATMAQMTSLPDSVHMAALRPALLETVEKFKAAFVELTGENPWA